MANTVSKYRNKRTESGYASKREEKRAFELKLLEKSGEIFDLKEQVKFELIPKQGVAERAVHYIADFAYSEIVGISTTTGRKAYVTVVEDVKGVRTPEYVIKRKLMLWVHKIKVREV